MHFQHMGTGVSSTLTPEAGWREGGRNHTAEHQPVTILFSLLALSSLLFHEIKASFTSPILFFVCSFLYLSPAGNVKNGFILYWGLTWTGNLQQ